MHNFQVTIRRNGNFGQNPTLTNQNLLWFHKYSHWHERLHIIKSESRAHSDAMWPIQIFIKKYFLICLALFLLTIPFLPVANQFALIVHHWLSDVFLVSLSLIHCTLNSPCGLGCVRDCMSANTYWNLLKTHQELFRGRGPS